MTAQWKANTNTVTFKANWPAPISSGNTAGTYPNVTATYGSATPKPSGYKAPSKTGYKLLGWYDGMSSTATKYLNADGTNAKDWDKTTTGTKTLYAHWQANSYTVTLDLNTGSKASGTNGANLPNSTSVGYYQKFADNLGGKDVIRVPEKTHYTFAGFNSKKDGSGTAYISKKRFADPGAHEYYDILEIDDTCQSWTTAAGGTIYAKWNYSISFNANGGSGTVASKTGTYDPDDTDKTKITLPSSTAFTAPANKYFAGWNTKANGTGTSYAASAKVGNLGNTTLFAQWKTKPTVTLDPNGGAQEKASWMGTAYDGKCTVIATIDQYLPDGGMTNKAKAPTRTGYTFDGYYTKAANGAWGAKYYGSAEANGTHYLIPTATWTIANDTILYAKWTPLSSKALLDPNGGTQNPWSWSQYDNGTALYYVTATYDAPMPQSQSNMKAPVPTRTGYTFDGYYTKTADGSWGKKYYGTMTESGSKCLSSAGNWKETASVVRLYAKWTPNVYKITLDKNGATTAGTAVLYLKYEDGWYGSGTPASAANGGAGSVAGSKLSSITKPSGYAGHTFAGYAKDGSIEFIDKDGKIASGKTALFTADATVKAKWTVNKHKVKFDAGISGETTSPTATNMPAEREVAYGSSTTLPDQASSPQRLGYTFYCWSDQADGYGTRYWPGGSYTLRGDKDVTLYAVWNRGTASYTVEYYYQNKDGSWPTPGYPNLRSTGIGSTDLSHTIGGSSLVPKDHSDAATIPELDAGERHLLNNDKYGKKNVLTATIAANGTTVFEVYFKLQFQVTYGNSKPEAGTVSSAMNGWRDYNSALGAGPQATPNDGYYFEEWSPGNSITPGYAASNLITGVFSYLAKWGMHTYTATLGAEGGTISDPDWTYQAWPVWSREFNVESPTFHLPVPERLAYTFKGWTEWKDGAIIGGPELDVAVHTGTVGDKEWRAEWERNRYTIAFDANQPEGASTRVTGEMAPQEVECYSTPNLTANAYVLDGYTFGGWKGTDRFGNEVEYADGQQIEANSLCVDADATVTLYAIWVPNTYKLTFLENKGSHPGDHVGNMPDPAEMDVVFDRKDAYRIPDAEPARVGYEFGGWALAEGSTEVFAQPGDTYTHEVGEHMPVAGDLALYAIWLPAEGGNGYRFHFYKFTDKAHDKSLCEFTSAFTGPVDFEIAGEPAPIELPGDRTLRTDKNRVDVPGYFLYGWTWVSDWSGIPEGERARYILPTDTDMREIVIDKLGITDPALRDIELFAVWQVAYHFDVPADAAVASLVLDASEKETWRASDVVLASTTPCPITVEAWSEAQPVSSEVFPATDLAQIDFLYDIGQGRDNPQLALDGSARRTQQIGTVPAGTAGAAGRLSGKLSVTFRDKAQVNISQKVAPGSDGTVMNGTVWDEPIARIHWLLSMDPAGALTHTLLTAPPSAPDAGEGLPGDGSIEVQATPSERADGPGA